MHRRALEERTGIRSPAVSPRPDPDSQTARSRARQMRWSGQGQDDRARPLGAALGRDTRWGIRCAARGREPSVRGGRGLISRPPWTASGLPSGVEVPTTVGSCPGGQDSASLSWAERRPGFVNPTSPWPVKRFRPAQHRSSFFVFSRSMWSTAQLLADWYIRHLANHMHPGHAVSARCVVQVRRRRVQTRSRRPPVELGRRQPPHTHSDASHLTRSDPVAQLARTNTSCSPMRAPT